MTRLRVIDAGVDMLDASLVAHANVATLAGCLGPQYLAAWMIVQAGFTKAAADALHSVAPVGEKARQVAHARSVVAPYLAGDGAAQGAFCTNHRRVGHS